MTKILEFQDITKVFRLGGMITRSKIKAVDGVSLHVGSGEVLGLAGESGCGKTTISRMILGFEKPTTGRVIHRGKDNNPIEGEKVWLTAGVQAVFQNPFETFNPLRKVENYFFETLKGYHLVNNRTEALTKINQVLKVIGLNYKAIAGRYPSEFSGGQLQRISIAKALLIEPSLLIADEPVSMVDSSLRMSIVNLFQELKEKFGVSVVYITHDLATAYYVCDRIAVMLRGNLIEMGDVKKVLTKPKHPYTKLLLDSVPKTDPRKRWTTRLNLAEDEREEYLRIGCKFAGRCPQAMEKCKHEVPKDVSVDDVLVKCFLYE